MGFNESRLIYLPAPFCLSRYNKHTIKSRYLPFKDLLLMQPIFPVLSSPPTYQDALTTPDGLRLFTQGWQPSSSTHARIALVHGYAEHSSRYAHVATHFVQHGYAVHTYDQRGYGRSEGRRAYISTFDQYVDDLAFFIDNLRERTPGRPLFLLAHSMGGVVSLLYVLQHAPNLAGLLLSSPALKASNSVAPLLKRVAHLLGRLVPTLPVLPSNHDHLSRNASVIEHANQDDLFYSSGMRARTGSELLRAQRWLYEHMDELTLPFFVFHGTADSLIDPQGSRDLYRRTHSSDKTLRLYDGSLHEALNDLDKERVMNDLTDWLDERMPASVLGDA